MTSRGGGVYTPPAGGVQPLLPNATDLLQYTEGGTSNGLAHCQRLQQVQDQASHSRFVKVPSVGLKSRPQICKGRVASVVKPSYLDRIAASPVEAVAVVVVVIVPIIAEFRRTDRSVLLMCCMHCGNSCVLTASATIMACDQ
eukprot:20124-Heterococcus_DN1.PRE.1